MTLDQMFTKLIALKSPNSSTLWHQSSSRLRCQSWRKTWRLAWDTHQPLYHSHSTIRLISVANFEERNWSYLWWSGLTGGSVELVRIEAWPGSFFCLRQYWSRELKVQGTKLAGQDKIGYNLLMILDTNEITAKEALDWMTNWNQDD